jgi:hypothetical protein
MDNALNIKHSYELTKSVVSASNLWFVLILLAGIFLTYLVAMAIETLVQYIEDRNPRAVWVLDTATQPFLMFILSVSYGIGFTFLVLPGTWKMSIDASPTIILLINFFWLAFNFLQILITSVARRWSDKLKRAILAVIVVIFAIITIVLFYQSYVAILVSALFALFFVFIIEKIISSRKPKIVEKVVIPKKMVISHIYLSTSEPHDRVSGAIDLIKEAIVEIPGADKDPQVTLSSFLPNAFDLMVKYFILKPEKFEELKNTVNLNIIKKLNEKGIKISTA